MYEVQGGFSSFFQPRNSHEFFYYFLEKFIFKTILNIYSNKLVMKKQLIIRKVKMPGCAAVGCNNRSEKGYTMKCFPRDPYLRNIWKRRVGRADWEPSNNSFLCHVHFESNQWVVTPSGKIKLKKDALPSIFTVTSTRKSPKKRQKMGAVPAVEIDLEDFEIEYLENDGPLILNVGNEKTMPNIINVQTENADTVSGQTLQSIKIVSGDTLKNLQDQNIIIVADENNKEIGRIVNDSNFKILNNQPFILVEDITKKLNIKAQPKHNKQISTDIKVEVKEEVPDNSLNAPDYDEIERKLQEICHSENDDSNNKTPPKIINMMSIETESSFSLDDLENISDSARENSNQEIDSDTQTVRTGVKRKRNNKSDSLSEENPTKTSQSSKESDLQLEDSTRDIISNLEEENSQDSNLPQSDNTSSIVLIKENAQTNSIHESVENNIQENCKNNKEKNVQNKNINAKAVNNVLSTEELIAKLNIQGEVIEKLTNQLIMYKDMDRKMKSLKNELQKKNKEIKRLTDKITGNEFSSERNKKNNDDIGINNVNESNLQSRIDYLEENCKQLAQALTFENQNHKKLECTIKHRNNQIKELNWKLEKASKFLDRAEKNTNKYKKKMTNMQALLKRKQIINGKSNSVFEEFTICQYNQDFTDVLETALEIEKACSLKGYQKLLDYKFPLPSLEELSEKYPDEINYCKLEVVNDDFKTENSKITKANQNVAFKSNTNEISETDVRKVLCVNLCENSIMSNTDHSKINVNDSNEISTVNVDEVSCINFNENSEKNDNDISKSKINDANEISEIRTSEDSCINLNDNEKINNNLSEINVSDVPETFDILENNVKMEHVEYLDPEFLCDSSRTIVRTVQDIFDECSDSEEESNITELKLHIMLGAV